MQHVQPNRIQGRLRSLSIGLNHGVFRVRSLCGEVYEVYDMGLKTPRGVDKSPAERSFLNGNSHLTGTLSYGKVPRSGRGRGTHSRHGIVTPYLLFQARTPPTPRVG